MDGEIGPGAPKRVFLWLRYAMPGFGLLVGLVFPPIAYFVLEADAALNLDFYGLSVIAGLVVGGCNYLLFSSLVMNAAKHLASAMHASADAYLRGENPCDGCFVSRHRAGGVLGDMEQAFSDLEKVVAGRLQWERQSRSLVDALAETVDLDQTSEALLSSLVEGCHARGGVIYVQDAATWTLRGASGPLAAEAPETLAPGQGLMASLDAHRAQRVAPDPALLPWLAGVGVVELGTIPVRSEGKLLAMTLLFDPAPADACEVLVSAVQLEAGVHMENARLHHRLGRVAAIDELTGLLNRRFGSRFLEEQHARTSRDGSHLSVMLFDVDRFKRFNDTYGHDAGDAVLVAVSASLTEGVRSTDAVVRWGGEELLVVAPAANLEGAGDLADRLRAQIASLRVMWKGEALSVTVSAGVSSTREGRRSTTELVGAADKALYAAKRGGRDQVVLDDDEADVRGLRTA